MKVVREIYNGTPYDVYYDEETGEEICRRDVTKERYAPKYPVNVGYGESPLPKGLWKKALLGLFLLILAQLGVHF